MEEGVISAAPLFDVMKSIGPFGSAPWRENAVTIIVPFRLKGDLPYSGDITADALQDSLTSIHDDIERDCQHRSLRSSEIGSTNLRQVIRGSD